MLEKIPQTLSVEQAAAWFSSYGKVISEEEARELIQFYIDTHGAKRRTLRGKPKEIKKKLSKTCENALTWVVQIVAAPDLHNVEALTEQFSKTYRPKKATEPHVAGHVETGLKYVSLVLAHFADDSESDLKFIREVNEKKSLMSAAEHSNHVRDEEEKFANGTYRIANYQALEAEIVHLRQHAREVWESSSAAEDKEHHLTKYLTLVLAAQGFRNDAAFVTLGKHGEWPNYYDPERKCIEMAAITKPGSKDVFASLTADGLLVVTLDDFVCEWLCGVMVSSPQRVYLYAPSEPSAPPEVVGNKFTTVPSSATLAENMRGILKINWNMTQRQFRRLATTEDHEQYMEEFQTLGQLQALANFSERRRKKGHSVQVALKYYVLKVPKNRSDTVLEILEDTVPESAHVAVPESAETAETVSEQVTVSESAVPEGAESAVPEGAESAVPDGAEVAVKIKRIKRPRGEDEMEEELALIEAEGRLRVMALEHQRIDKQLEQEIEVEKQRVIVEILQAKLRSKRHCERK
jgi:hypothetical protein